MIKPPSWHHKPDTANGPPCAGGGLRGKNKHPAFRGRPVRGRGFALVITVSLMVLLALLAVGLLGLSAVALRGASQGSAHAEARANARMALMIALGELQRELGPDRRINAPGGIRDGALPEHRHWVGVYDAWTAGEADRPEPRDQFRQYLVSGDPVRLRSRDSVASPLPDDTVDLVSLGTLGRAATEGATEAGLVRVGGRAKDPGGDLAWWISDDNAKAMVNAGSDIPGSVSDELLAIQSAQASPGTGFPMVESLAGVTGAGRGDWDLGDALREKLVTLGSVKLAPGAGENLGVHFHDLTTRSSGVLADVRTGRLKRDLSLYLQQDLGPRLRQPLYNVQRGASVNFSPDSPSSGRWDRLDEFSGITMEELWLYHHLAEEVDHGRPAGRDPLSGLLPRGYPTLVGANTREDVIRDPFYIYKRRIYSQVKYVLGLAAAPNPQQRGKYDLRISVDPVVTLWNPNNVAVEYQPGAFTTVGFSSLPYQCRFEVTGDSGTRTTTVPFGQFFAGVNGIAAQIGKTRKIVLRPGESRVFSPASDTGGTNRVTVDLESGWDFTTGAVFDHGGFPKALAANDRVRVTLEPKIQNAGDDYITYWFGSRNQSPALQSGTVSLKNDMELRRDLPVVETPQAYPVSGIIAEDKIPLMLFSYYLRPENDTGTPSKSWIWSNPAIIFRWPADNSTTSRLHSQFEMKVVGLDTWENPYIQITPDNQAYWGGGVRADFGVPFFTFRSIPLTPPISLGRLQHACANGFRRYWKDSPISIPSGSFPANANALDGYRYLAPMASRVIGNSFAHPLIAGDRLEGTLFANLGAGNGSPARDYTTADHSYLANAALWDSWYFSSLAPQTLEPYGSNGRNLQQVFDDFFPEDAAQAPVPLPSSRLVPFRGDEDADLRELVERGKIDDEAYRRIAGHLMVEGAFNVNSTSTTAWKVLLASLRDHATARRGRTDEEISLEAGSAGETPVNGLIVANGSRSEPTSDPQEPDQWTGFRTLEDGEIEDLAARLVEEIRLRGPFLCLSDFVNRRPGRDADLARQGALQAAIEKAGINGDLDQAFRGMDALPGVPFPEAAEGSKAAGIPGFITQADLLTPLGPVLQARSDCFTIRAHGSARDAAGNVIARAWCEATVQRTPDYLDPADEPDVALAELDSDLNRRFGRRFDIIGFRWLSPEEI